MTSAAQSYATLEDLAAVLPPAALAPVDAVTRQKLLVRASAIASAYLRDRYALPLCPPYDPALVDAVCQMAAYHALSLRGLNPQMNGADWDVARAAYTDAMAFLKSVANGQAQLCVVQQTAPPNGGSPDVATNPARGFGSFGIEPGTQDYPVVGGLGGGWGT